MTETTMLTCVSCGCDGHCPGHLGDGHGCHWLRSDSTRGIGVCSECPEFIVAFDSGVELRAASIEGNPASMAGVY